MLSMIDRRNFLKSFTAASCVGLTAACATQQPDRAPSTHLERIGLGLFTIPHRLQQGFAAAMKQVADVGYKEVEFFGPYPFSAPQAHDDWKLIAEALGLSRSGYFGLTAGEARSVLDDNGLSSPSMHIDMETLRSNLGPAAEAAHTLGQRYAGIAAIPPQERETLDGYKRVADEFNEIGGRMEKLGLKFLYHNHGYGLVEMDGEIPFKVLLERTDPNLVVLEMDVYWLTAGRADPISYLDEYPDRFRLMHIKDMTELVHFAGDGGDPAQWIELFPHIADAGDGVLDLAGIITRARQAGVEHFYLERDLAPDADQTLEGSFRYLSSLEFQD